ncbi:MAG: hypothetical protein QF464_10895 [Myxococcota bacterium]|nr:hypothetical protein [Myxococcota bacterium]
MSQETLTEHAPTTGLRRRHLWVPLGVLALFILHQDLWLWSDASLWLGPLPAGLAYHAGYSLVVAAFWWAVVRFAWPAALEDDGASDQETS